METAKNQTTEITVVNVVIKEHRDIHGARNILTKTLHGKMTYFPIDHPTYLRPVILGSN